MRPESPRAIRVLVVDDDERFAMALRELLGADPRLEVVGTAANGNMAIRLVTELKPDVVTMDLEMPVTNGVEATRAITSSAFRVPIVIVSGSDSNELLAAAVAAGAAGYVPKENALTKLVDAVVTASGVSGLG